MKVLHWYTSVIALWVTGALTAHAASVPNEDCFDCHELVAAAEIPGLDLEEGDPQAFPKDLFALSAHADLDCIDCHLDFEDLEDADHTDLESLLPVDCSECHEDEQEAYIGSLHFAAREEGHMHAAGCTDCHGKAHALRLQDDPESPSHRSNIPGMCANCHENLEIVEKEHTSMQHPFESYTMTVHGTYNLEKRDEYEAAVCSDCHASHNLRKRSDPESKLFKFNIPQTCGACHEDEMNVYLASSHGRALEDGIWETPVCTDCHGEHNIYQKDNPDSFTKRESVGLYTCARCHEDQRMIQRFGFSEQVASYKDSFHGLALRSGDKEVANCASCHGYHNVLASSDPESSTHPDNLPHTCGQCHPGLSEDAVLGQIHVSPDQPRNFWVRLAGYIYIPMILLVIGGMFFHNVLDFMRKEKTYHRKKDQTVVRFSRGQRTQHLLLVLSFVTLVLTGFALKYPNSWWVEPFNQFEWFYAWRAGLHRIAAVVMVALAVYHLLYLIFCREGRRDIRLMAFKWQDIKEMRENFTYFIRGGSHPKFGRFSYMEKAEYWALQWGTIIMALTGFLLWFEEWALSLFPIWVIDLCTVVHLYEAILATLAIIVWHLYYVIVNHNVYPLSRAMVTGKVSEAFVELEHPREQEEVEALENRAQKNEKPEDSE